MHGGAPRFDDSVFPRSKARLESKNAREMRFRGDRSASADQVHHLALSLLSRFWISLILGIRRPLVPPWPLRWILKFLPPLWIVPWFPFGFSFFSLLLRRILDAVYSSVLCSSTKSSKFFYFWVSSSVGSFYGFPSYSFFFSLFLPYTSSKQTTKAVRFQYDCFSGYVHLWL